MEENKCNNGTQCENCNCGQSNQIDSTNIETFDSKLEKLMDGEEFTEEELKELEKQISEGVVMNGKKVDAKINMNGKKQRLIKFSEIKDIVKSEMKNRFNLGYKKTKEDKQHVWYEGEMICSTNIEDDSVMFWLDTKTDLPFSIDFTKNPEGEIKEFPLDDEEGFISLLMDDKAILINLEERMVKSMDLRTDEALQQFLSKITIYDGDRFKVNHLKGIYTTEQLKQAIERMTEVGYLSGQKKFQNTGIWEDDYYFVASLKYIRKLKFDMLEEKI